MNHSKPNQLLSTIVVVSVALLWCFARLYVFAHTVIPLTYVLPLLICVWSQRRWQVWFMAAIFSVAAVAKFQWMPPARTLVEADQFWFMFATLFNILAGAIVIQAIIGMRERLEYKAALIAVQYAELEAQTEEISQQNEEIRAQNEELAEQNEEIETQSEEAVRQNEELADSNKRLTNREVILQGLLDSARNPESARHTLQHLCKRTLTIIGAPACAVAILERDGDRLHLHAQATIAETPPLPWEWPLRDSIASLVLEEAKTAYVSDLTKRADLAQPFGVDGSVRSVLATPVHMAGFPGGVLILCSATEAHWTQEQFQTAEWLAAQFGLVTENARWQKMLAERAQEVEQASRAKDNFLATLSHELRMPLTPILMTAAVLRDDDRLPEEVRVQLSMIERNIALEARLIDDLLDLTRIAKGKLPLRQQLCDAHSLISLALEIVRDDAQEKGVVLEREFHAELSGLMADPSRFQQVMWNLLRNAVKFTPKGGHISIRTSDEQSSDGSPKLRIEVIDSGIGIDSDSIDNIFHPFEQGAAAGDHRFGGLGLGLSIARAIVDLHHGTITAESPGHDKGSTFTVELPGATSPPPGVTAADHSRDSETNPMNDPALSSTDTHSPLRILLVEDHEATLQVLTRLLIRNGYTVTAVNTITAAQTEAASQSFDLVISDLGLPDGSGNELMEILRGEYALRGIALSGYGMEEDIERSRKSGFLAHLVKPIDMNQLRRAITTVLGMPHDQGSRKVSGDAQ